MYKQEITWHTEAPKKDDVYVAIIHGDLCGNDIPFVSLAEYKDGRWDPEDDINFDHVIAWAEVEVPDWAKEIMNANTEQNN